MAARITITLERDLAEATAASAKLVGKSLDRESVKLDFAARACKVPAIASMLSENQAALIEQMKAEGFDPTKMRLPPEQWSDAREGLAVVRRLAEYVTANLNSFKQPNPILKDLKAAEEVLKIAEDANVRFHFTRIVD